MIAQALHMNAEVASPSLSQSYDTLMTLKADQTIRTSDNLDNLILSIINPLLNIHSRITTSYPDNQSCFTFAEVDPIDTVNEGLDQLLSILNLLDNDFIRPTHELSNSLKSLRRRLGLLQGNSTLSSTHTDAKSIRQISKQNSNLLGTLMNKTRGLRQVLKEFIYWADTELMASLASSKTILSNQQDKDEEIEEDFYNLIDQCVDIVQSTYQLNLYLKKLQFQFHELIITLGSLNLLVLNNKRKVVRNQKDIKRVHSSIRLTSNLVFKFLKSIDPNCLITVHGLMKTLESSIEERR